MTTPQGHPDFQQYAQWRGPAIVAETASVTTASPLTESAYVSSWASLQLMVSAPAGEGVAVNLSYYSDSTMAFLAAQHNWQVWASQLQVLVPVRAPYAVLTVSTRNAGTMTPTVYLAPTNVPAAKEVYPGGFGEVSSEFATIAASGSLIQLLPQVMTGYMTLMYRAFDASSSVSMTIDELDDTGTSIAYLGNVTSFTATNYLSSYTGERVTRLTFNNNDASNPHSVAYRLRLLSQ